METNISLLDELKSGGYEASLITTFNAYMPFYEDVVFRRLGSNGVRHNVLMMDQAQCQQSIANHPPRLAGRRYTLLPMHSNGAFHPKIILLVGKNKGLLAVGSHNLTLSGFGLNLELTNIVRYKNRQDDGSAEVIKQAWHYILDWLRSQGERLPHHLVRMVETVAAFATWLSGEAKVAGEVSVIASSSVGPDLLSLLRAKVNESVSKVIVGGAFFDSQLAFLKRLQREFNPSEFVVGIDPKTVSAPSTLNSLERCRVVDVSKIPFQGEEKEGPHQYLHAKYLLIETESGRQHLITGSANPSAPAWFETGLTRNTEMMLVRSDAKVNETLDALRLSEIAEAPQLAEKDWETIKYNWEHKKPEVPANSILGIAVAADGKLRFDAQSEIIAPFRCELVSGDGQQLEKIEFKADQQFFVLEPASENFSSIAFVKVYSHSRIELQFFVHHESQISEQSKTGTQRKFSEALASLSFSSPDLVTFLNCVERIIFSTSDEINQAHPGKRSHTDREKAKVNEGGEGFSIDVSNTKKIKKKHRLQTKEDLAYLLDILIYHLKIDDSATNTHGALDKMGRSEEEQISAEDSEEEFKQNQKLIGENDSKKILQACHRKVKTLVNRAISNLAQFKKGELDIENLLVKLVAVLAVLRELRNCDGVQSWVEKGKTTVPFELRKKLLLALLANLFEGEQSLLHLEENNPNVTESEYVSRLKGLIIWLAWDCRLEFLPDSPHAEKPAEAEDRLVGNAILLALAQQINNDAIVIEQAKESIGPLCSGDLNWLSWLACFGEQLKQFHPDDAPLLNSDTQPGDIAIHAALPHLGYRLIQKFPYGSDMVAMVGFEEEKPLIIYRANVIRGLSSASILPN